MNFAKWIDVFLEEKGIDVEQVLHVDGPSGDNAIPIACLVALMKQAPKHEQAGIKGMIVKLDFLNKPVVPYLEHLAKAVAI